jgi:hypothetical protein
MQCAVLRIRDVYPGSRILIFTHPGSRILDPRSRIPDPKTATKGRSEKFFLAIYFFCHKFHKIQNYFIFELLKIKIWAKLQRIIELLPKKLSLSSQKYELGIREPGSRGQKGTGSQIRICNTGSVIIIFKERFNVPPPFSLPI